jgi:hypothetical protein
MTGWNAPNAAFDTLNFRIETSRPCANARRPREFRGMELHEVCHTRR